MASAKEYNMLFKLSAALSKEFGGTFSSAQKTMSETQKAINALGAKQSDIVAYQKQQTAVAATERKLKDLQQEYDNVQREIDETGTFSSALENKLIEKQSAIDKTTASLQQQTEKLGNLQKSLQDAGIDTSNLESESKKLAKKMDDLTEKTKEYGEEGATAFESVGELLISAGIAAGLKEMFDWYSACVQGASAYADEIGTVAAQYGIATDDLQAYYYAAELVDVSTQTLTKSMAKNIKSMKAVQDGTKLSVEAYERLGVEVLNADGSMRESDAVYWEVIDALGAMTNESERDALAQQILGKSAMELNTLIKAGSGVMNEYKTMAQEAGYIMSGELLDAVCAMDDQMQITKVNTQAFKNTIGAQFAPEITAVTKVWNGFVGSVTKFASEHPAVVKSIIAIAGELGAFLIVYNGYKAAKAAMNTLSTISNALKKADAAASAAQAAATVAQTGATVSATGAQLGLNAAMAANPIGLILTGIAALTVGVIAIAEKIKSAKAEMDELTEASRSMEAVFDSAAQTYKNTAAEIEGQAALTEQYISQLEQLEAQGVNTREEHEAYAIVVEKLNALYPDLNAELDTETGLLKNGIHSVKEYAEAWRETALQKALTAKYEDEVNAWAAAEAELYTNKAKLKVAEAEHTALLEKQLAISAKMDELSQKYADGLVPTEELFKHEIALRGLDEQFDAIYIDILKNEDEQKKLNEAIDKNSEAVENAKAPVNEARMALELFSEEHETAAETIDLSNEKIAVSIEKLNDLAERYKSVQDAAEKSVSGQYALWDTAAVVIVTKIEDINTALETQSDYWSDYNQDLETLQAKTKDIEGLSDVIASFADGSAESVNAIAGMANASDEDLKKMVENWQAVKKEQEAVVKSIQDISLGDELDRLRDELEQGIENMSLETEAYNSAKATIDAYIQAIKDGLPEAEDQAKKLASIFGISLDGDSASTSTAYASGTASAARGVALVGERGPELVFFGGGEQVMTAEETRTALSPLPMKQSSQVVDISIAPQFVVNGEPTDLDDRLREFATVLVAEVQDAISEAGIDAKRGAYA